MIEKKKRTLWNYLWTHLVLTGMYSCDTRPYPSSRHLQGTRISWVIASSLHSSPASWHTDVFCFPSSKQFYVVKKNLWLNFFQTTPLPTEPRVIALPCPILWHHMKGLRDRWHSLHHRISLKMLMIQFPRFLPTPSPGLWRLDGGSLLFLAFHQSPSAPTPRVCQLASLFVGAFNTYPDVLAFSVPRNPTYHPP